MNNMPPPYRRTESARKVDWSSRDLALAAKVMRAAETIKNRDGRPERITVSGIGRLVGSRWVLQDKKYLGKLPLTQQALESTLESSLAYYERKIAWAIRTFPEEGPPLSFSTLAQRTAIKWGKWYQPEVKQLLLNAIDNFGRLH